MSEHRFPPAISLSRNEALDLVALLEEAADLLAVAGQGDAALELNEQRLRLLDKLTEGWA